MTYIHHVNGFYSQLQKERRLNAYHISLYMALFESWNRHRFQNPFPLYRDRLMQLSGIGSRNTYSKCLKELHQYGYIVYNPSLHEHHRPKASIIRWTTGIPPRPQLPLFQSTPAGNKEPIVDPPAVSGFCKPPLKHEQGVVPDMGHLLLKIDSLVCSNVGHFNKQYINKENKERAALPQKITTTVSPAVEAVQTYFKNSGAPENEALRFFFHYQANGWRQSNNMPITSWQAAASKWIINIPDFKTNTYAGSTRNNASDHLNAQRNEDYSDPL